MSALRLSFESKEDSLSVRRFTVHEAISAAFEASIVAASPNEDLDLESFVGRPAGFMMAGASLRPRVWTGIVSHMEQLSVEPAGLGGDTPHPGPASVGVSLYLIRIVPALWLTTQRRQTRIFQHVTVPAIVQSILEEYGIKPRLALNEEHPEHEYRVQYGETDFAFVSRLLEEEGISFWFTGVEADDGLKSELVLGDRPVASEPRGAVRYVDNPNEAAGKEFVTEVHVAHAVRPGKLTIRDFDFKRPDYELKGLADGGKAPEDFCEQYVYEHGAFEEDARGKTRARIALESARRARRHVAYQSNVADLGPGVVFAIDGHPRRDLAPDRRLLVVEATHEGTSTGEWTTTGFAAFAAEPYRPAQTTPRPRIHGVQSAVVVGPAGEEIHTDEHGRVRVQFHWDRTGALDDKSSCWLRVSHGWAGAAYGTISIPRVGQEVIVGFWGGDPDQPVVVGRVYNAKNRVPYKLPEERTKSTWKSHSTPKSDGFNEILFEDKAGSELLFVQAQRDLSKLVKHDETERTGQSRTLVVGKDRTTVIGATDTTLVGSKLSVAMVKPKDLAILKMGKAEVEPLTTMLEMEDGRITLTTGKATVVLDGSTITLKADGNIEIKAGGEVVIHGNPFVKINC